MEPTKYWTWHMFAGVVLLLVLGLHMLVMHMPATSPWFVPYGTQPDSLRNSLFRDAKLFFTVTYVLLLGVALYHGLYGLRTILFARTLKPAIEKTVTDVLLVLGLTLFCIGSWAALAAHSVALAGAGG